MTASPRHPPLTRRAFLRAGSVAAALPLLGALPRAALPGDPEVLKVGLVGCGGRGTGAAFQALRAEAGTVHLTAMADVFADKLDGSLATLREALGADAARLVHVDEDHRFVGFDAGARLIASDVDVVLLAAPPHFRPVHLAAAVAAGKHVFTEKPMAVDAPGVRSVLASARQAAAQKTALVSGFCWRSNVRHREFYRRLHDGAIGDIRAVYSTYNASPLGTHARRPEWTEMDFQLRNWQHFCWLSGDHIVEQAVHSLDKQAWTMRDVPPLSVTAVGGRSQHHGEERGNVFDHFSATFDYADGVKAFHMARQWENASGENSDYVYGAAGTATINGWANEHVIEGPQAWTYDGPGNDMYQTELDELFASVRAGAPRHDGEWMAHSTLLAIMARMAAYTGRTLTWDEALASNWTLAPEAYAFGPNVADALPVPGRTRFS